jgi:hypothetical protein
MQQSQRRGVSSARPVAGASIAAQYRDEHVVVTTRGGAQPMRTFELRCHVLSRVLMALCLVGLAAPPARAAIDALALGAKYDASQATITFKVYSSRATRVEVWTYKTASGAQERVRHVMTKDAATQVWSKTASVTTLQNSYGVTARTTPAIAPWGPRPAPTRSSAARVRAMD